MTALQYLDTSLFPKRFKRLGIDVVYTLILPEAVCRPPNATTVVFEHLDT